MNKQLGLSRLELVRLLKAGEIQQGSKVNLNGRTGGVHLVIGTYGNGNPDSLNGVRLISYDANKRRVPEKLVLESGALYETIHLPNSRMFNLNIGALREAGIVR